MPPEAEDTSSNDADVGTTRKTTRPATNEWQSAATVPSTKRPRIEPADGACNPLRRADITTSSLPLGVDRSSLLFWC